MCACLARLSPRPRSVGSYIGSLYEYSSIPMFLVKEALRVNVLRLLELQGERVVVLLLSYTRYTYTWYVCVRNRK